MVVVMSECWLRDPADGERYAARSDELIALHRAEPGFRGRALLQGSDDPRHLVHMRWFDSPECYDRVVAVEGYADHIAALGEYLDLSVPVGKEHLRVLRDDRT